MIAGRSIGARDQAASQFSAILMRLCEATDAVAAALVDGEGETVDYAGSLTPFEIKVAAAELRLIVQTYEASQEGHIAAELREIVFRASRATYRMASIGEGYAIVLRLRRRAFEVSRRAMAEAVRETCTEAGLLSPTQSQPLLEQWVRVEVKGDHRTRRPTGLWLGGEWAALDILGRCAHGQLARREVGYRIRLRNGAEFTLVREPSGRWYADNAGALRQP